VYFLRSESEEDTNKWMTSISAAIDASRVALDEGQGSSQQMIGVTMPTKVHLSEREIQKAGWLHKQGGKVKSWKKRWFVLSNTLLYYFKHPEVGVNLKLIWCWWVACVRAWSSLSLSLSQLSPPPLA
jgi:PH domain